MSRVLLDRNVPVGLRGQLAGHIVRTTDEEGWSTLTNGELIAAGERDGFDVMVSGDKNLAYQQNLSGRRLALVILGSPAWPIVRENLAMIANAVGSAPRVRINY